MAKLFEKESSALIEFRERLADLNLQGERNTDAFLLRWLRARDLKVNQAEEMLRKSLKWREDNNIDDILNWEPPKQFLEEYPFEICGIDNEGCPVIILPFGRWNNRKVIESGGKADYIRYIDRLYENTMQRMRELSTDKDVPVTQFQVIYEMDQLSYRQLTSVATVDTILETVRRFEANHPETLKACFVVNASRIFAILFALVKPFLTARTLGKVQVFTYNANKWKTAILKGIPENQLPAHFGGTKNSTISYYFTESPAINEDANEDGKSQTSVEDELIAVTVEAGDTLDLEFEVIHAFTELSWTFKTDSYDIGYSLVFNDIEKLISNHRVNSHLQAETGTFLCEQPGKYTFKFDNTYSRLRAKTLRYTVKLQNSNDSPNESDEAEEESSQL